EEVRPPSFAALAEGSSLRGKRIGIPRMFVGDDPLVGTGPRGVGGPTGEPIELRPSLRELLDVARADLEAAGAIVVD
ncbi:hypothetical protein ABTE28_20870, partial [Acinetobacter baumannii]